ncbi:MAG: hypothetical protein AB7F86_19455 [Bdellovibrionales bacterium]
MALKSLGQAFVLLFGLIALSVLLPRARQASSVTSPIRLSPSKVGSLKANVPVPQADSMISEGSLGKLVENDRLRQMMAADELGEDNPFAALSNRDTLDSVLARPILKFERQTLRSSSFRDESGYDMVYYSISHTDGTSSAILAYLDQPERLSGEPGPKVKLEVPTVLVTAGRSNGQVEYALLRAGHLVDVYYITDGEAQGVIAERLASSVPFLSVSR